MNDLKYILSNAIDRIVYKVTSGQWILCLLSGIAFLYSVIHQLISTEASVAVFMLVFQSYFKKESNNTNENTQ